MSSFGGRGGGGSGAPRVRKVMTQAINLIFEFLKNVSKDLFKLWMETFMIKAILATQHEYINLELQ